MNPVLLLLLSVHLFAATMLVGGSSFIWLVAVPASRGFGLDEPGRTRVIGQMAKRFGLFVCASLAALIGTGIILAVMELGTNPDVLLDTPFGRLVLLKMGLVAVFLVFLYVHNVVYGRRIVALARAGRTEELRRLRRRSRPVAYANLVLLVVILLVGVLLHHSA